MVETSSTSISHFGEIARDFLSISATYVPGERLFSKASLVVGKHRSRLNNESVSSLAIMH